MEATGTLEVAATATQTATQTAEATDTPEAVRVVTEAEVHMVEAALVELVVTRCRTLGLI